MSLEEMDEVFRRSKNMSEPPKIAKIMIRERLNGHSEDTVTDMHEHGSMKA